MPEIAKIKDEGSDVILSTTTTETLTPTTTTNNDAPVKAQSILEASRRGIFAMNGIVEESEKENINTEKKSVFVTMENKNEIADSSDSDTATMETSDAGGKDKRISEVKDDTEYISIPMNKKVPSGSARLRQMRRQHFKKDANTNVGSDSSNESTTTSSNSDGNVMGEETKMSIENENESEGTINKSTDESKTNISIDNKETIIETELDEPCDETVHNLLTVPMKFIVSKSNATTKGQRKLLHGEASCFLKIRLLASEIDVLLGIASESLERRMKCRQYSYDIASVVCSNFHDKIVKRKKRKISSLSSSPTALQHANPLHLRSIIPILYTHGEYSCESQLSYVESNMRRCLKELYDCGEALHQFSEQNLSVAEQLSEMFTIQEGREEDHEREHDHGPIRSTFKGHALANEKMIVGEIEEALCSRINALVKMSLSDDCDHHESTTTTTTTASLLDAFEIAKDPESGQFLSMKHLCERFENLINDTSNSRGNDKTINQIPDANEMETIPKNVKMESETFDDTTLKHADSTFLEAKEHGETFSNTEVNEEVPMMDVTTESIEVAATTLSALHKKPNF